MDECNTANLIILWSRIPECKVIHASAYWTIWNSFPKKLRRKEKRKSTYISIKQLYFPSFIHNDNPFGALLSSEATTFIWNEYPECSRVTLAEILSEKKINELVMQRVFEKHTGKNTEKKEASNSTV